MEHALTGAAGGYVLSTLTKVFAILLVVFSISFSMMTVSVVSQVPNWKENAEKADLNAQIAETNLRNLISGHAAELASSRDRINTQLDRIGGLEAQVRENENELGSSRSQIEQARGEKASTDAINRGLIEQLNVERAVSIEYESQRTGLETKNIDLERKNMDLSDRVNELTAQLQVSVQEQRQYEQQVNMLRVANRNLTASAGVRGAPLAFESPSGVALPGVRAVTAVAQTAVHGKVLEVDGQIVTLSVGSADGVLKGMVFIIHRDENYVGDVKISEVKPNRSAGFLTLSRVKPQANDRVTDKISMELAGG